MTPALTVSSWTLGDQCRFEERLAAAKQAGFTGIGLRAETYADALAEGYSDQDLLRLLHQYGLRVTEVEYIVAWAEDRRSYEQMWKEQVCFHMCKQFGVGHINCGLMEQYPLHHTARKLAQLCQRAGELVIGVEPMPYSGIPDVRTAWDVVRESRAPNAAIILDSWHWVRAGQPHDLSVLDGIPAEKIVSIQINDVHDHPYPPAVLRDESMHDRLAPGTGCGDTLGFLRMIRQKGVAPRTIGVEVISDPILAKGVEAAARFVYDAAARVFDQLDSEVSP